MIVINLHYMHRKYFFAIVLSTDITFLSSLLQVMHKITLVAILTMLFETTNAGIVLIEYEIIIHVITEVDYNNLNCRICCVPFKHDTVSWIRG